MAGAGEVSERSGALEAARLFIEALNARDLEAAHALVTPDLEMRTHQGRALRGYDAVDDVVRAAADADLLLVRQGPETVEEDSGAERVTVPVRVIVRKSELRGTAMLDVRDRKVAAFEIVTT